MTEARKATDVLLDLEAKVDTLLNIVRSQDLNIKVLSNKFNEVMKSLDKQQTAPPKITVEATQIAPQPSVAFAPTRDPERSIPITAEGRILEETAPQGFRRSSRPETYADAKSHPRTQEQTPPPVAPQMPSQAPKPPPGRGSSNDIPVNATQNKNKAAAPIATTLANENQSIIPIEQRVVDANGKSVWVADVEVVDHADGSQIAKTRTNGTGKWFAALPIGNYQVTIRKFEMLTKQRVENVQTIRVDGTESPLRLPMLILK